MYSSQFWCGIATISLRQDSPSIYCRQTYGTSFELHESSAPPFPLLSPSIPLSILPPFSISIPLSIPTSYFPLYSPFYPPLPIVAIPWKAVKSGSNKGFSFRLYCTLFSYRFRLVVSTLLVQRFLGLLVTSRWWPTNLDCYSDVSFECGKPEIPRIFYTLMTVSLNCRTWDWKDL